MQFCPFHILTKGGQGGGEPVGLGGECRKERGWFPGQSAFHRRTGGRERGELWPQFPTPLSGSWKKSSLIGSLAVSFTLNIKVHQTVRERRGEGLPWGLGWDRGPPLTLALRALCLQAVQHHDAGSVWPRREPPLLAQPGRMCPSPPPRQHTAKQTN